MYTPTIPSIVFGDKTHVALQFDPQSFKSLVTMSITNTKRSILHFQRSKDKMKKDKVVSLKMTPDQLMNQIGLSMEIIQHAVWLSNKQEDIKLSLGTNNRKAVKRLLPRVEKLIFKIGQSNNDFISLYETQRARPSTECLEFVKKNW